MKLSVSKLLVVLIGGPQSSPPVAQQHWANIAPEASRPAKPTVRAVQVCESTTTHTTCQDATATESAQYSATTLQRPVLPYHGSAGSNSCRHGAFEGPAQR